MDFERDRALQEGSGLAQLSWSCLKESMLGNSINPIQYGLF